MVGEGEEGGARSVGAGGGNQYTILGSVFSNHKDASDHEVFSFFDHVAPSNVLHAFFPLLYTTLLFFIFLEAHHFLP